MLRVRVTFENAANVEHRDGGHRHHEHLADAHLVSDLHEDGQDRQAKSRDLQKPSHGVQRFLSTASCVAAVADTMVRLPAVEYGMESRALQRATGRHAAMSFWKILGRTLRLRCPQCGAGRLFDGWFSMPRQCEACGLTFEREPGYFLGSIYFNYGVTAIIVTVTALTLMMLTDVSERTLLISLGAFCVLFPAWFFRYARGLWMAWDHFADPPQNAKAMPGSAASPSTERTAINR